VFIAADRTRCITVATTLLAICLLRLSQSFAVLLVAWVLSKFPPPVRPVLALSFSGLFLLLSTAVPATFLAVPLANAVALSAVVSEVPRRSVEPIVATVLTPTRCITAAISAEPLRVELPVSAVAFAATVSKRSVLHENNH
jgi:hypothetical protein